MEIQHSIQIGRSRTKIFEFMSDMRNHSQEEDSKVLLVEKITEGEIGLGTRFREVVQMFPFLNASFINTITKFEPDEQIEITWHGGGMEGVLRFHFDDFQEGTLLKVVETIHLKGVMKLIASMIEQNFREMWEKRLHGIERVLISSD
jgi:carbon monoxide dehydrogenase subunit G